MPVTPRMMHSFWWLSCLALFCTAAVGPVRASPATGSIAPNVRTQRDVVTGTVRTADGRPVGGAVIHITGPTGAGRGAVIEARTGPNGVYRAEVPAGYYLVYGRLDVDYAGQQYRELWLDPVGGTCERRLSRDGIVQHFVLRVSGRARCVQDPGHDESNAFYGATIMAGGRDVPEAAAVIFTFTPLGRLADGSTGRPFSVRRTGAALGRLSGPLGETGTLHDIPIGRYRLTAVARYPDGTARTLRITRWDDSGIEGEAIEFVPPAKRMFPYGLGIQQIRVSPASPAAADANRAAPTQPRSVRPDAPPPVRVTGLPEGSYACSYEADYVGTLETGTSVQILDGTRYRAPDGRSGSYSYEPGSRSVRWTAGPFAERGVRVEFLRSADGRAALRITPPNAAPRDVHTCVLSR